MQTELALSNYISATTDSSAIDNPDQRMTTDVDTLCTNYGSIVADVIVAPFTIGYYAYSAYTR